MTFERLLFSDLSSRTGDQREFSPEYIKDLLHVVVSEMQVNGVEFADALYDKVRGMTIRKDKAEERVVIPPSLAGIVLRVYKQGQWNEAGLYDLTKDNVLTEARKLPSFSPTVQNPVRLKTFEPCKVDGEIEAKIRHKDVSFEEKIGDVRRLYELAKNSDNRIVNVRVGYQELLFEKIYANSEGSSLRQLVPRTRVSVVPIAKSGERIDYDYLSKGKTAGYEVVRNLKDEEVLKTVNNSIELLDASTPPLGEMTVILDPGMTGMFAHESFGHGCEEDQVVRGRSYLIQYAGKGVGPENLSIYDDGSFLEGHGSYIFDDEGAKSKKNTIIENGVLKGFLNERYTTSVMDTNPTGNARRESFMRKLFVRMTNTYVGPGDMSLEELMEDVKYGVMLVHGSSGMEDPLAGGIQLKSKKGYLIENGEKTKVFSMLALSGHVLELLSNISGIGRKDYFELGAGMCGKGHEDYVPVGDGGSYIKSKAVVSRG